MKYGIIYKVDKVSYGTNNFRTITEEAIKHGTILLYLLLYFSKTYMNHLFIMEDPLKWPFILLFTDL